jgi:uncharacterized protein YhaN
MDKRLLEVMSEILIEVQDLKKDNNKRFDSLEGKFEKLEGKFEKLEGKFEKLEGRFEKFEDNMEKMQKQQAHANKGLSEVRLSVMKLSDKISVIADHEKRIKRIEKIVLK